MTHPKPLRNFLHANDGVTIIEFAVVAPVFFLLFFAIIEYGLIMFSQIALESATMQVSRSASIEASSGGCDRVCTVKALIQQKTAGLINGSTVTVTANTVAAGGAATAGDICLTDPPCTACDCPTGTPYEDVNHNGVYDKGSDSLSLGDTGDLVEIRASYPWKVQFPMISQFFGQNGVLMISASTIIKNE